MWGEEINLRQNTIKLNAEECASCTYHVEKEIMRQKKMLLDGSIELGWDIIGETCYSQQFHDLGKRAISLAIQSADVERSCKAHGHIHTNVRNRLKNKNVQKLLYLYVNMRLLRKAYDPPQNFLNAIIDDDLDEPPSNDQQASSEQNA